MVKSAKPAKSGGAKPAVRPPKKESTKLQNYGKASAKTIYLTVAGIDKMFPNGNDTPEQKLDEVVTGAERSDMNKPGVSKHHGKGVWLGKLEGNKADDYTFGGGRQTKKHNFLLSKLKALARKGGICPCGLCKSAPRQNGQPARITLTNGPSGRNFIFVFDAKDSRRCHAPSNVWVICKYCNDHRPKHRHGKRMDLKKKFIGRATPKPASKKPAAKKK